MEQQPIPDNPGSDKPAVAAPTRKADPARVGHFLAGFFGSIALSAIIFTGGGWLHLFSKGGIVLMVMGALASAELITSLVLIIRSPRFRRVGVGILASLPISAWLAGIYCANTFGT